MAKATRAEWVKRVERWQDSGLTAKEFALELAVSPNSLTFWKWKLRRESSTQSEASAKTMKPVVKAAEPKFLQLVPTRDDAASAAAPLEVVIRGDIVVRVTSGFDEQTLTRVLRALGVR
jgi:transposase